MWLSLVRLSGARVKSLPDWLLRIAPCRLWLEDETALRPSPAEPAESGAPSSYSLRLNDACDGGLNSHTTSSKDFVPLAPVKGKMEAANLDDAVQELPGIPHPHLIIEGADALPTASGPTQSNTPCLPERAGRASSGQDSIAERSRLQRRIGGSRGQYWDLPFPVSGAPGQGGCTPQQNAAAAWWYGARNGAGRSSNQYVEIPDGRREEERRQPGELSATGDIVERATGRRTAGNSQQPSKPAFISSLKHDLIRHLDRLRRRSEIRRECDSVLLLGYPLIRFMSSPWFYRLVSRQPGGLLRARRRPDIASGSVRGPAEDGSDLACKGESSRLRKWNSDGIPVDASVENSALTGRMPACSPRSHAQEVGRIKFDLLVTDSAALVNNSSLSMIQCSESVHASTAVVSFLTRRDVPEYLRTQGSMTWKPSGDKSDTKRTGIVQSHDSLLPGARGISAVALLERPAEEQELKDIRCLLALDRVKYVGNVGVLVRAAAAFGFDGIFCVDGSADPFNWKVMEVSNGLHYNLRHFRGSAEDLLAQCKRWDLLPVVADTEGVTPDCLREDLTSAKGICCVLGNESYGAADVLLRNCKRIRVPMSDLVESLNVAVAGGIVMYEVRKLLERSKILNVGQALQGNNVTRRVG